MTKLAPSLEDLVWAGPRMVMRLGRLGSLISFPEAIDGFGQRIVPGATDMGIFSSSSTLVPPGVADVFTESTAANLAAASTSSSGSYISAAATAAAGNATQNPHAFVSRFSMEGAKGLGGVFSYATSKWALCCIAMAIIFNRTHVFAATRRRLRLRWHVRLLLRVLPVALFMLQARWLLQSIQCQTSNDFSELRWANSSKSSDLMFSYPNPVFNRISSTLLFGASDEQSCRSVKMVPWDDRDQLELTGSLSRLWPLFGTYCLSQFVEVLACAVQGRPVAAETGMTLFEHSLAFAEADAAISNQLGWGLFTNGTASASHAALGSKVALTRSMILKRVNTPPEVLVVALLSAMSHTTSHILGIFNLQSKFRLLSTGFWGLCFMASLLWSAFNFSVEDPAAQGLMRFPTVCIIGFIPHILILCGIFTCGLVYAAALTLSALSAPEADRNGERPSIRQRLQSAHANMQANVSLSDIRIRMDMDFYTALLRAGFGAITMASEAVYLNEDHQVNLKRYTWLEDDRFRELEELRMQWIGGGIPGSRFDSVGTIGLVPVKDGNAMSGYARERAAQQIPKSNTSGRRVRDGVGAAERSSRWLIAFDYLLHIVKLMLTVWALITIRTMALFGLRTPPRWLQGLSQRTKSEASSNKKSSRRGRGLNVDILSPGEGRVFFAIPRVDQVDVEAELRRRMRRNNLGITSAEGDSVDEGEVDSKLYSYFLRGGWWGGDDASGDYTPPLPQHSNASPDEPDFDDTTSVISTTETASELDWESDHDDTESLEDGQRTPTQQNPNPFSFASAVASARASRESTPVFDTPIATADLARLLHPQNPQDRDEARALAAHLTSDGIMTRSRFKQQLQRQRAQVLLTNTQATAHLRRQYPSAARGVLEKMTPEEEARALEQLLLSRRAAARSGGSLHQTSPLSNTGRPPTEGTDQSHEGISGSSSGADADSSWATGAAGLGPDGPQCVVCQSTPRTIIVWPCRCLSLCDDCRVSLAMNNFDKCVCCRREVISFSRIYVP
ncbi:hypothetical protein B0J18DRAFT_360910 [Chaetomium sp. MPI-SDFR-AT-0129]|nr:hypothetical protein B0J18DRAFT_360910 [Chaetomium sp. MPI-SDFR-AT-0129]